MIRFDLIYESDDPAEVEAIAEAVRAAASRPLIVRSAGSAGRHRVLIALAELPDEDFIPDLTSVLSVALPLIYEFDPRGRWQMSRAREAVA